jgi:putative redox protein
MELTVASLGGDRHRITVRGPTPTDLFVASLASCVAHYARHGLGSGSEGPKVRCVWRMSETPPWRVAAISIDVKLPTGTTVARVAAVRRAVTHCTVHNSLRTPPMVAITATIAPTSTQSPRSSSPLSHASMSTSG